MIPGVAVIGGFVFTSLLSVFVLQSGINGSHQSTLGQALADEIAQQVNIKETQLIDQLAKIASSALATNTITGSIADLSAAELTIAQVLPFAEKVRLIPTGQAIIDQGFPPFNFVALDMVKGIEAGEPVSPEAISSQPQLKGEKWIIVAAPIKRSDGNIQGTFDGLRVDFADGWGLVKASNTEPALTLRFEADSNESLENIKSAFRELLQEVKSDLNFE